MGRIQVACALLLVELVLACSTAHTQVIDTTFLSTDGAVDAIVRDGNTIFIGGSFTKVGVAFGTGVPFDPVTAAPSEPFPRVLGLVWAVTGDGGGGWYVGGALRTVAGVPRAGLVHVRGDGSLDPWDPQLSSEFSLYPIVQAIARRGTILYVAGSFTRAGSTPRAGAAAFDLTSGELTAWNPSPDAAVRAIAADADAVYLGGEFSQVNGQTRNALAAVDPVTGATTSWDPQIPAYDGSFPLRVGALAASANVLYVGGAFQTIGGQTRRGIAALRTSDATATSWNPDAGDPATFNQVSTLLVDGTTVYAGGHFTTIGGEARSNLAALDIGSGAATSWNPAPDLPVDCLAARAGMVYVGGGFRMIGGAVRFQFAAIDSATGTASAWDPATNAAVLAVDASGPAVYVGGDIMFADAASRSHLAAFDAVTHQLSPWNPGTNGNVMALAVSNGKVYAGGTFTTAGGAPHPNLVAIDEATGAVSPANLDASGQVSALAAGPGLVYAGGVFTSVAGQGRNRLAAIDPAADTLAAWSANAAGGSDVEALAVANDTLYAGGSGLVALDATTGAVQPWHTGVGSVFALVISGNTLYVGGGFSSLGGQPRPGFGALDRTTAQPTSFAPTFQCGSIKTMARGTGVLYAAGGCTTVQAVDPASGPNLPWTLDLYSFPSRLWLDGDVLYVGGGTMPVSNHIQTGLLAVTPLDINTPVLASFDAVRTPAGVRLEWEVDRSRVTAAQVERAPADVGPWVALALSPSREGALARVVDASAPAGVLFYRLDLKLADGGMSRIGPVRVDAMAIAPAAGFVGVAPNPASGLVRVDYCTAAAGPVRLGIYDLAGREVERLVDSIIEAGTHAIVWEARRGAISPGVYFLRLRAGSRVDSRRVLVVR